MNYDRIYGYRFKDIDQVKKLSTWKIIAEFIYHKLDKPQSILDPAAGNCEFINQVPSAVRWAVDMNEQTRSVAAKEVNVVIGNNLTAGLPLNYFDAVYISNFLEHLHSQEEVAEFLGKMYGVLKTGGRLCVMGPNFKYCYKEYFDFADHTVVLSELGVAEHLYGAGFTIRESYPKFLPLSFRGNIPVTGFLVNMYLKMPFAWNLMGKQFLIMAQK
jgi:ubiquinone/menaquinone biosynthesis C-methylase UbiE